MGYYVGLIVGVVSVIAIERFSEWHWRREEEKKWRELLESDYFDD